MAILRSKWYGDMIERMHSRCVAVLEGAGVEQVKQHARLSGDAFRRFRADALPGPRNGGQNFVLERSPRAAKWCERRAHHRHRPGRIGLGNEGTIQLDTSHVRAVSGDPRTSYHEMPFSVYIAQPPVGGGYGPEIYKVGKTTEEDVQSRIAALNDSGSNYPTSNGENWELVGQFSLASHEQMDAFEDAMELGLGTGVDPKGTGATELFCSTALEVDVHNAALSAIKTLVENGLIEVTAVRNLAAGSGPESAGAAMATLPASTEHLTEDIAGLIAGFVWDSLPWAFPALGIGVALWRGPRIYRWMKRRWEHRLEYWRAAAPPRPVEPRDITEADQAFKRARAAKKNRSG